MGESTNGCARPTPSKRDPFFYGYREVLRPTADGDDELVYVPLTEWDVLHPTEGDHIMNGPFHYVDCKYLANTFEDRLCDHPAAMVYADVGVYYDRAKHTHHSPDVTVILGVPGLAASTKMYHLREHKVLPALVVDVVSRSTRQIDLVRKVKEYFEVGMALYVIVDRKTATGPPKLIGYRAGPTAYEEISLDARSRLWLDPVGLWLGTDADANRVVCYDKRGRRIKSNVETSRALTVAERAASKSAKRAKAEAKRAEAEAKRADTAEERIRALEAELRRRKS